MRHGCQTPQWPLSHVGTHLFSFTAISKYQATACFWQLVHWRAILSSTQVSPSKNFFYSPAGLVTGKSYKVCVNTPPGFVMVKSKCSSYDSKRCCNIGKSSCLLRSGPVASSLLCLSAATLARYKAGASSCRREPRACRFPTWKVWAHISFPMGPEAIAASLCA